MVCRSREQNHGKQADRRHGGRRIDALHDLRAQFVDRFVDPGRTVIVRRRKVSPVRVHPIEQLFQTYRLTDVDVHLAEVFPERTH